MYTGAPPRETLADGMRSAGERLKTLSGGRGSMRLAKGFVVALLVYARVVGTEKLTG